MHYDLCTIDNYDKKASACQNGEEYLTGNVYLFHKFNSREKHLAGSQTILI